MTLSETLVAALDENLLPPSTLSHIATAFPSEIPVKRGVIKAHDALASILSFMSDDNVVAVGSMVTPEHVILFISCTKVPTNLVEEYVHEMWRILRDIWQHIGELTDSSDDDDPDSTVAKRISEFVRLVYRHSIEKLRSWYQKAEGLGVEHFFDEALKEESEYVSDEAREQSSYILKEELELLMCLQCIYLAVFVYVHLEDDKYIGILARYLSLATDLYEDEELNMKNNSFFNRCENIRRNLCPEVQSAGPSTFDLWEEIFDFHRSLIDIISLPLERIVRLDLRIGIIKQPTLHLKYNFIDDRTLRDIPSDRELTERKNGSGECQVRIGPIKKYDGRVPLHCECTLLAHFIRENIYAYGYIGLSRPACLGCALYFRAYDGVAMKRGLPRFFVREAQSGVHHPWVKPRLRDRDLDGKIEIALCRFLKPYFSKNSEAAR